MENMFIIRYENVKEVSGGNWYYIFDEKVIIFYLYGNCEIRVIDV